MMGEKRLTNNVQWYMSPPAYRKMILLYKQRHHCPALGTSGNLSNIKMDNMAIHRYLKNQH